ncbi:metallophosphoesterase family protein [Levilactobacillus yiduensis]|uniref:metallophosphoesterase family protein n=1 Tax=Levilactobacillus yiduensis TaxID=2953880 RepID=UPI000EF31FCA|nr:metallophosphoesterase family protein [Levilactobacillus yiduensis]AYM02050.1 metallophosphoesterase [Levilactobacillus brevis]
MQLATTGQTPFRICQLTDIHLGPVPLNTASQQTLTAIDQLLQTHKFDLILLTGDLLWGKDVPNPAETLAALYMVLNHAEIPVAVTYGNHDTEGAANRAALRELENGLTHRADKHHANVIANRESYTLEISRDGRLAHVLYVWDSGAYSQWPESEQYAAIDPAQIDWFSRLPYARQAERTDLGFLHIPLPEYNLAAQQILTGQQGEPVCSPVTNSGLFYTLRQAQNVKALFAGHDHDNNFTANYQGIGLNYGNVSGYNTYGSLPRGARRITLTPTGYDTEIIFF